MAERKIEKRVLEVLSTLKEREYQQAYQTKESAFSRTEAQKMSYEEASLFMVANSGKSLSIELLEFFNKMPQMHEAVTKQAFSKQRGYIKSELFEDLNLRYLRASYAERKELFHGYFLIAVDGSTCEIPNVKALKEYYGSAKASDTSRSNARAGLNGFYDPLNQAMLKLVVDRYQKNETEVFLEHVDEICRNYPEDPLCFIFDRGYISLRLLFELRKREANYLFRLPSNCYKNEIEKVKSDDSVINIKITKQRMGNVPLEQQEEYLKQEYFSIRLVKVELPSGEIEYLLTNIPAETIPYSEMKDFYFQRWEIERMFNVLKNRLHIENISARSPIGVQQDIQATVFLGNIVKDIEQDINCSLPQNQKNKYEYRVNINMLCGVVKNYFMFFVLCRYVSDQLREYHFKRLIRFLKQTTIANKKALSNPRIKKVSRNKHKTNVRNNY